MNSYFITLVVLLLVLSLVLSAILYLSSNRRAKQIKALDARLLELELRLVVRLEDRMSVVEGDVEKLSNCKYKGI